MKILQINTTVNTGSTGRIAEDIGKLMLSFGHESLIASTYSKQPSKSKVYYIGNLLDRNFHGLKTRLFDLHGFGSTKATERLVDQINMIRPDIIQLHNLHGYYLNVEVLFNFLKAFKKPIVWTLHDCWPFTGHCSHFESVNCMKWIMECNQCPNKKGYPESWFIDNSTRNYYKKKRIFNGVENLHIVTPSFWLASHLKNSYLRGYPVNIIHNGIDLSIFKAEKSNYLAEKYELPGKKIILGIANTWKKRKAFDDFFQLSQLISNDQHIFLVGLSKKQTMVLPSNMTGIPRTENLAELATIYTSASVFVNPTYVDTFPTTNIEALSCGTPVITYETGGSPEVVDESTGIVIEKGDIIALKRAIDVILEKGKEYYQGPCRARAEKYFNKDERNMDYLCLYEKLVSQNKN